jgi:hypothetical protein
MTIDVVELAGDRDEFWYRCEIADEPDEEHLLSSCTLGVAGYAAWRVYWKRSRGRVVLLRAGGCWRPSGWRASHRL